MNIFQYLQTVRIWKKSFQFGAFLTLLIFIIGFNCVVSLAQTKICTEFSDSGYELAGKTNLFWKQRKLKIRFLNGEEYFQNKVQTISSEWSLYANIKFEFVKQEPSDARISFNSGGSWSYIGNSAEDVSKNKPTMNFGWFDKNTTEEESRRVILHEFGHLLGFIHEHQSPKSEINWNKDAVYKYYDDKFGWSRRLTYENILKKYSKTETQFTTYDRLSIMHYSIPAELILSGKTVGWNTDLSENDKAFAKKIYR